MMHPLALALLATIAGGAIAYGVRCLRFGPSRSARVASQGEGVLLRRGLMEAAYWCLDPPARALAWLGASPDAMSIGSAGLALCAGACWATDAYAAGTWLAALSGALDCLDGRVARLRGVASDAGEIIDAVSDRYAELFLFGGLLLRARGELTGEQLALAALGGSQMVSYATAKSEALGRAVRARAMRRPERFALLLAGGLASSVLASPYALDAALAVIAFGANAAALVAFAELRQEMLRQETLKHAVTHPTTP